MVEEKIYETPNGNIIKVNINAEISITKHNTFDDNSFYTSKSSFNFEKLIFNEDILEPYSENDSIPSVLVFQSPEGILKLLITKQDICLYLDNTELRMLFPEEFFKPIKTLRIVSFCIGCVLITKGITSLLGFYPMSSSLLSYGFILIGLLYFYIDLFFYNIHQRYIPLITYLHHAIIAGYIYIYFYRFISQLIIHRDLDQAIKHVEIMFSSPIIDCFSIIAMFTIIMSAMMFHVKMLILRFYLRKSSIRYSTDPQ